jgi:modulator of FtsH protease HflC
MRLGITGGVLVIAILVALILGYSAIFTVYQTQQALVVRLGQPVGAPITEPGLHFKMPLIDSVIYIDKRILGVETTPSPVSARQAPIQGQLVIASDQQPLVVDAFARYRINDALLFYQKLNTLTRANQQLENLLNSAVRRVLGEATSIQVVRDERAALMARVREQLDREAQAYGVTIIDVRIKRADLPEEISQNVYQRMKTEREREAAEYRAQGSQRAQEIRAKADRDVTVIVAEATSKSEQVRGEGDAERNRIFADAFGRDPDFFAFYRSMQAYEAAMKHGDTRMLLRPDSEFFRYFVDPSGKKDGGNSGAARQPAAPR